MLSKRTFFKAMAGMAALPLIAKLPAPLVKPIQQVGAWAVVKITGGQITSITITNVGPGYTHPSVITFGHDSV
jgi:hypothetical protein